MEVTQDSRIPDAQFEKVFEVIGEVVENSELKPKPEKEVSKIILPKLRVKTLDQMRETPVEVLMTRLLEICNGEEEVKGWVAGNPVMMSICALRPRQLSVLSVPTSVAQYLFEKQPKRYPFSMSYPVPKLAEIQKCGTVADFTLGVYKAKRETRLKLHESNPTKFKKPVDPADRPVAAEFAKKYNISIGGKDPHIFLWKLCYVTERGTVKPVQKECSAQNWMPSQTWITKWQMWLNNKKKPVETAAASK